MNKGNLFITHTPYHILMAATVVKQDSLKDNTLIIFEDFKFNKNEYLWLDKYFKEVILLKSNYALRNVNNNIKNRIFKIMHGRYFTLKEVLSLKALIKKLKVISWNRIHCFNDIYEKVQILINNLKEEDTKIIYVEDGSAAYWIKEDIFKGARRELKKPFSPSRIMLRSFNFLKKHEMINVFGGGSYINSSYFLYPNLICNELKIREAKEIKSEYLKEIIEETNSKNFNINNSIILLAELYSKEYEKQYKKILEYLKDYKIYIKYHPRESVFYINDLMTENHNILPNNIPLENILLNSKNNIIIGTGGSTVFLTLPKISENYYISLNRLFNMTFSGDYEKTLENIGVAIPRDYDEFHNYIKSMNKKLI